MLIGFILGVVLTIAGLYGVYRMDRKSVNVDMGALLKAAEAEAGKGAADVLAELRKL